jgi:hypothetical protein
MMIDVGSMDDESCDDHVLSCGNGSSKQIPSLGYSKGVKRKEGRDSSIKNQVEYYKAFQ